jgi:hypothetical protein
MAGGQHPIWSQSFGAPAFGLLIVVAIRSNAWIDLAKVRPD